MKSPTYLVEDRQAIQACLAANVPFIQDDAGTVILENPTAARIDALLRAGVLVERIDSRGRHRKCLPSEVQ